MIERSHDWVTNQNTQEIYCRKCGINRGQNFAELYNLYQKGYITQGQLCKEYDHES